MVNLRELLSTSRKQKLKLDSSIKCLLHFLKVYFQTRFFLYSIHPKLHPYSQKSIDHFKRPNINSKNPPIRHKNAFSSRSNSRVFVKDSRFIAGGIHSHIEKWLHQRLHSTHSSRGATTGKLFLPRVC